MLSLSLPSPGGLLVVDVSQSGFGPNCVGTRGGVAEGAPAAVIVPAVKLTTTVMTSAAEACSQAQVDKVCGSRVHGHSQHACIELRL